MFSGRSAWDISQALPYCCLELHFCGGRCLPQRLSPEPTCLSYLSRCSSPGQAVTPPCRIHSGVKGPKGYCYSLSSACDVANCHGREAFGRTGTGENSLTSITCRELMGRDKEPLFGSRMYNKKLSKIKQESFGESQKNYSLKEEFQSLMQRFGILQCLAHDCQKHDCL